MTYALLLHFFNICIFGCAVLKAYLPSPSTAVGSAPARISITTIGKCPCLVAQCNGVELSVPPNLSTTAP